MIGVHDLAGGDRYNVSLESFGSTGAITPTILDEVGNDKYTFAVAGQNSESDIWFMSSDYGGSDSYVLLYGASSFSDGAGLTMLLVDSGRGRNNFATTFDGLSGGGGYVLEYAVWGTSRNTAKFNGNGVIDASSFSLEYSGSENVDKISFDDYAIIGDAAHSQTFRLLGQSTSDKLTMRFDGSPGANIPALSDGAAPVYDVNMGAGHDSFAATIYGELFTVVSTAVAPTAFAMPVHGGGGNDRLTLKTDRKLLTIDGEGAVFAPTLWGDGGHDRISVDLNSFGSVGGTNSISISIFAGDNVDKIKIEGMLTQDNPGLTTHVMVDLSGDSGAMRDTVKSTIKYAASPMLSAFDAQIWYPVLGDDVLSLSDSPLAPVYTLNP